MAQSTNPWNDDDLEKDALLAALDPNAKAPTSTTMPVSDPVKLDDGPPITPAITPGSPGTVGKWDQWSGPSSVTNKGDFNRLEGFDRSNFNDDTMQTLKYQQGRIFSRYDPDDPNASAKVLSDPEFQQLYPNAKAVGPDKIDYGDGRPVDFIRGYGAPGAKFSWQTEDAPGTQNTFLNKPLQHGGVPLSTLTTEGPDAGSATGADPMAEIMKEIEALQGGNASTPLDQQALLDMLGI
jgi:hypothetical protein